MTKYRPYIRKTKYYETDQMGIVHHSNYIRFLEECRIDFLEQIGLPYRKMEDEGIFIPVLSVHCEYQSPIRFDDVICIIPFIETMKGLKFEISYRIYSEDRQVLHGIARTSHCFLNHAFQPLRLKKEYPELYHTFMEYVGKDMEA